tara:strand:+ start:563 stop:805 length:243 start_codon:yes stop_codon:yes gene_type:complete
MKSFAGLLMISSLVSLIIITFAYRDFSLMLLLLFTHVFLGTILATFFLTKNVFLMSKNEFSSEDSNQDCELINKFNINSQ